MDPWHYDAARDLDQPLLERLRHFPREPDMLVYGVRLLAAALSRTGLRLYHRLWVSGRENLPRDESFVMVANHASHLDALCLLAALPLGKLHHAFPAAARDYFFVNAPRLLLATVMVNALPFDRRASPRHSLSLCRHLLDGAGNVLIVFPEGTRSSTGEVGEFKPGVGLLVAGTNRPVVPCYVEGAHRAWPKGCWFPRPRKVQVRIGTPRRYPHLNPGKDSALRIARELRDAVVALAPGPACRTNRSPFQEIAS
jgi:1-acyl-sn-glycerol-3-phosphate acyltransferase